MHPPCRRARVAFWAPCRVALKIAIGGYPGYQHLCSLILHWGRCQSHGGDIDCNLKREIYGFYTLNGCLPGAQHWRWIRLPLRPIIQPLLASTCAHLIGQLVCNCQPPGPPKTEPKPISLIDPNKWYKSPLMLADRGIIFGKYECKLEFNFFE